MPRTPLHTRPETIEEYARLARDLLDSLSGDVTSLLASNEHEVAEYPERDDDLLAGRMERESWVEHTTQQLRDVLYLLAVGDRGPTDAAAADPEGASKQAHADRRRAALQRLEEQGLLP